MPFRYLFLLLFSLLPVLLQAQENANKPTLYAAVNGLRVRSAPELDAETVHHMAEGEAAQWLGGVSGHTIELTLRGIKYQEPWLEIKTWDGKTGWVYGGAVRFFKPQATISPLYAAKIFANVDNLSVRDEPNLKAKVVGRIPEGDAVKFLGRATEKLDKITLRGISYLEPWVLVELEGGAKGWAYAGGLRIHKPVSSLNAPQWWLNLEKRAYLGRIKNLGSLDPKNLTWEVESNNSAYIKPEEKEEIMVRASEVWATEIYELDGYGTQYFANIYAVFKPRSDQFGVLIDIQNEYCCHDVFLLLFDADRNFLGSAKLIGRGGDGGWDYRRTISQSGPTTFEVFVRETDGEDVGQEWRMDVEETTIRFTIESYGHITKKIIAYKEYSEQH